MGWLSQGEVKKVVLVLMDLNTQEPLERWTFDIETDEAYVNDPTLTSEKSPVEIQREISAIMRQISASVTYLPLFESPVSFDILIYTKSETQFPSTVRTIFSFLDTFPIGLWHIDSLSSFPSCQTALCFSYVCLFIFSTSQWDISDPHYITMSNEVNLRSFNTKIHSIKPSVSYKVDDE